MCDGVDVGVGPAVGHSLLQLSERGAAGIVLGVRGGGGRVADPVAVDIPAFVVEAGEEEHDRAVLALGPAVDVRLRHALAVLDRQVEVELRLSAVELEIGFAAGVRVDRRYLFASAQLGLELRTTMIVVRGHRAGQPRQDERPESGGREHRGEHSQGGQVSLVHNDLLSCLGECLTGVIRSMLGPWFSENRRRRINKLSQFAWLMSSSAARLQTQAPRARGRSLLAFRNALREIVTVLKCPLSREAGLRRNIIRDANPAPIATLPEVRLCSGICPYCCSRARLRSSR